MKNSFIIFVAVLVLAACDRSTPTTQPAEEGSKVVLSCMIVRWHPGLFEMLEKDLGSNPPVLTDIETFFLIDHPAGTKSTPTEFHAGETIQLRDTFGSEKADEYVQVRGSVVDNATQLEISSAGKSTIKLTETVAVELPRSGSTIIKTANPMVDNRNTYLWVMARNHSREK